MKNNENRLLPYFGQLHQELVNEKFVIDKSGVKMVELISPRIELDPKQRILDFGIRKTPIKYADNEVKWYNSMDLSVKWIGEHAQIWKQVANKDGFINSNYGYLLYHKDNYNQYENSLNELKNHKESRRSAMIYNRPSMWEDYNKNGMSDFICTFATQQFIRNDKLVYVVNQRSCDMIYGFFNDFYWHSVVYERFFNDLKKHYHNLEYGTMIFIANSLHIYERHFHLLKEIIKYG